MTTRAPVRPRGKSPVGREEVAAAVLAAAAELFAERGPAATSIRDIAARSNVNHGLVFRHFGTKEQLVGAVLDHLGASLNEVLESGASEAEIEEMVDRHMRVMARSLLDGYPVGQLQSSFPNVARRLEAMRPRYGSDRTARLAVANAVALQLGWRLFEPFLRGSTSLDELSDEELRQVVADAANRLLEPQPAQEG